ncbi:MAG: hypothetical protein L7F78_18650, partial [Syntrophales bacterium LBB04]|nr:hypothetical protein [Syntrophales bacterium LBB04]
VKARGDDKGTKINIALVSFRLGPPTWDQFIKVTYRSGSEAGIRIIIHEGAGFDKDLLNEPTGNANLIGQLVYNNNNCGMVTYLVEAKGLIQRIYEGKTKQINYQYEVGPLVNDNPSAPLPTIRRVQEAEFWNCYYLAAWGDTYDGLMGLAGNGKEWAKVFQDLSLPVIWNDDGLHLNVFGDADSELVKLIWENKLDDLQKAYPEPLIKLLEDSGKPYGISIRIADLPMSNLIKLGPRKKKEHAEFIFDAEHNFMHVIDDILDDLKDTGKLTE